MRNFVGIVATLLLMVVGGIVLYVMAIVVLMEIGSKLHGNYEYYGSRYGGYPALILIFGSGAVGFLAPGAIVWYLRKRNWRFSLRTLLIAMTLIAVVLGIALSFISWVG